MVPDEFHRQAVGDGVLRVAAEVDEIEPLVVALPLAEAHEPVRAAARERTLRRIAAVRDRTDLLGVEVAHAETGDRRVVDELVVRRVEAQVIPELDITRQHLAERVADVERVGRVEARRIERHRRPRVHLLREVAPAVVEPGGRDERVGVGVHVTRVRVEGHLCARMQLVAQRRERHVPRVLVAERLLVLLRRIVPAVRRQIRPHRRIRDDDVVEEDEAAEIQREGLDTIHFRNRCAADAETRRPLDLERHHDAIERVGRLVAVGDRKRKLLRFLQRRELRPHQTVAEKRTQRRRAGLPLFIGHTLGQRILARQDFDHNLVAILSLTVPSIDRVKVNGADTIRVARRADGRVFDIAHDDVHRRGRTVGRCAREREIILIAFVFNTEGRIN